MSLFTKENTNSVSKITKIELPFILYESFKSKINKDILVITSSEEEARTLFNQIQFFIPDSDCLFLFCEFDNLPYDRVSPSRKCLSNRAKVLTQLSIINSSKIVIASAQSLLNKLLPKEEIIKGYTKLQVNQKIDIDDVSQYFLSNGYIRSSCVTEPGDFAQRGDIFDVYVSEGEAYRINFSWEKVESIKFLNVETQLSSNSINSIEIFPAAELTLSDKRISTFRENYLKNFGVNNINYPLYNAVISGMKFPGIEALQPIFYENTTCLLSYLNTTKQIYYYDYVETAFAHSLGEYQEYYESRIESIKHNKDNFYPAVKPFDLVYSIEELNNIYLNNSLIVTSGDNNDYKFLPNYNLISQVEKKATAIDLLLEKINNSVNKKVIIFFDSLSSSEKIKYLLKERDIYFNEATNIAEVKENIIYIANMYLKNSYQTPSYILVSSYELLGEKKQQKSNRTKIKNILNELDNFSEGELVVHENNGIGLFSGIEAITVNNIKHDCIKLIYSKGDKFFIPVENIDQIKRYGSEDAELDSLGSSSWQRRKSKLKDKIKDIAKNLMQIAAKRKLYTHEGLDIDLEEYKKFCDNFPYVETDDQLSALEDIIEDLKKDSPMERLICGDVGFGKTEVAMRAAHLITQNRVYKKQVAILVPTTILCRQHFASFKERFRGFNIRIAQLSRLVSANETAQIVNSIENGDVDIIIGTHQLLGNSIKFKNLGLIIVDEEQHFGVEQKEKLKSFKESVHCLTLSATPIPRTLQMSLLGIKDLSIIATPPIDRLSTRTSVIPFDEVLIRDALMREHYRGGRSFFVCPRIKDIEDITKTLTKIIPELKYAIAHGQMSPNKIDQIMTDFYDGKYDVLLSTAIVESGLDVPAANTMVIYKAENFGLSQLYQLRGRVGRGKVRGFAYLFTNKNKLPTKSAIKRLEIMQTVDSLGAGFSIASHDMDIRGFGNLVGDEQSGHVKEVGVELYQDMLEEAVNELKGVNQIESKLTSSINLPVNVYIPEDYIKDQSLRLSIYRRIADLNSDNEITEFKDELIDRFGLIPLTVQNLIRIISLKILCKKLSISQLDSGDNGFVIKFYNHVSNDMIMKFINANPRNSKLKPDNKLVYITNLKNLDVLSEAECLLKKL